MLIGAPAYITSAYISYFLSLFLSHTYTIHPSSIFTHKHTYSNTHVTSICIHIYKYIYLHKYLLSDTPAHITSAYITCSLLLFLSLTHTIYNTLILTHRHTYSNTHVTGVCIHIYIYLFIYIYMTDSTENATTPKSTKSSNSNSSVQILLLVLLLRLVKPKSQFRFVPRDTKKFEFFDLVDFGELAFQWKLS